MNRVDARRLREGDCVLIHASQFLFFARHSHWIKGKVFYAPRRSRRARPSSLPEEAFIVHRTRIAPRRSETWVKFLVGREIRTLVNGGNHT
jgi:hypothetical protein